MNKWILRDKKKKRRKKKKKGSDDRTMHLKKIDQKREREREREREIGLSPKKRCRPFFDFCEFLSG
jgi:hypothetical protein